MVQEKQKKLLGTSHLSLNIVIIIATMCECMNLGCLMGKENVKKLHDNKAITKLPYHICIANSSLVLDNISSLNRY